jgi:hypothetical protein
LGASPWPYEYAAIRASEEGEILERQIAICWLLLKGDHWVPVSPERRMTVRDRSSPDWLVIMAEVVAEVEGTRILGWRKRIDGAD